MAQEVICPPPETDLSSLFRLYNLDYVGGWIGSVSVNANGSSVTVGLSLLQRNTHSSAYSDVSIQFQDDELTDMVLQDAFITCLHDGSVEQISKGAVEFTRGVVGRSDKGYNMLIHTNYADIGYQLFGYVILQSK